MARVAQRKQQLVEAKANRRWNRTKSKSMEKSSTDKKRAAISQIRKRPSATQRAASTKDLYPGVAAAREEGRAVEAAATVKLNMRCHVKVSL